jgi:hypothetical protein
MGVGAYLEQQLHPERVPADAVQSALAGYTVLEASPSQLVRDYPQPTQEMRRQIASGDMTRRELRELMPMGRRPPAITAQLQAAAVTRAVVSEAQLEEVLAAFWFNHFNVFSQKGAVRWMVPAYEREAIRPHVLGKFRDLLLATARHPAMLFYLDNWMSTRADLVMPRGPNGGRASGLNENYARELMELHTLGVDGGYTQQDVTEVARCFTGWTIDRPREGGPYLFRTRAHDAGSKRVLGETIPAGGGERDGERVIDILVRHPSTARFISTKLARHFVSDQPPAALVDRMAATFRSTDGDIRAVMTTLVTSPEFWSRDAYRAKIKTPFEVVVSAVRALGGRLETGRGSRRRGVPGGRRPGAGARDRQARAAALRGAAAYRLSRPRRIVGQHRRAARPDELRAVARAQPLPRRAGRSRSRHRSGGSRAPGAGARRAAHGGAARRRHAADAQRADGAAREPGDHTHDRRRPRGQRHRRRKAGRARPGVA